MIRTSPPLDSYTKAKGESCDTRRFQDNLLGGGDREKRRIMILYEEQ
jgi:hypothetical protein